MELTKVSFKSYENYIFSDNSHNNPPLAQKFKFLIQAPQQQYPRQWKTTWSYPFRHLPPFPFQGRKTIQMNYKLL